MLFSVLCVRVCVCVCVDVCVDLAPPQQTHFLGGERNTRDRALFDFCAVQELPNLAYVGLVAGAQPHVQYGSGLCVCVCVCVCVCMCV